VDTLYIVTPHSVGAKA